MSSKHDILKFKFKEIYKIYLNKIEKKGRTIEELDEVIFHLTGYTKANIESLDDSIDIETFFQNAPCLNSNRYLIKGTICNVKIEDITDMNMKEVRYLDKLVDELARGKSIEKILAKLVDMK